MPISQLPTAISPMYPSEVDEPILLYGGPCTLHVGSDSHDVEGTLTYVWQPIPGAEQESSRRCVGKQLSGP